MTLDIDEAPTGLVRSRRLGADSDRVEFVHELLTRQRGDRSHHLVGERLPTLTTVAEAQ